MIRRYAVRPRPVVLAGLLCVSACATGDKPSAAEVAQRAADALIASPGLPPGSPVPRCTTSVIVPVAQLEHDSIRIVETRLDGKTMRLLYAYAGTAPVGIDRTRAHVFGDAGIVDLASGTVQPITHAADYDNRQFLDARTVVAELQLGKSGVPWTTSVEVRLADTDSLVAAFNGYAARVVDDGSVLFLRAAAPSVSADSSEEQDGPPYVDIMRWTPRAVVQLKRVAMNAKGGPYELSEVVPLPKGGYAYRISDEHEHRYLDATGAPFFAGVGHLLPSDSGGISKEQYGLVVSPDGRSAAYAERTWGELTALVVVDLAARRRTQTRFYGSFPAFADAHVVFVSDPAFITGGDVNFRQIKEFGLYAYHLPTRALCEVRRYPFPVTVN